MSEEKKELVSERIMHHLANNIIDGTLPPGGKLPSERDLAKRFAATRNQVREALSALSLVGLVNVRPNDGTFVSQKGQTLPANTISWMYQRELQDIYDLYQARKLIETEVIKNAFDNISPEELGQLEKITTELQEIVAQPDYDAQEYNSLLEDYDFFMGKVCGNEVLYKLMQTVVLLRRGTSVKYLSVPGAVQNSIHYRVKITEAFIARNKKKLSYALNAFYAQSRKFYNEILTD